MLGNLIGETRGKRIVRRVLSATPARIEVTFEDAGKMLGVEVNGLGTYTSEIRADGSIYGEGQGLYLTATGEGLAWKGSGLGRFRCCSISAPPARFPVRAVCRGQRSRRGA